MSDHFFPVNYLSDRTWVLCLKVLTPPIDTLYKNLASSIVGDGGN